jgi:hypothetical protein
MRYFSGRLLEGVGDGLGHLVIESFGIVTLCGRLFAVAQDILDLLHLKSALIE